MNLVEDDPVGKIGDEPDRVGDRRGEHDVIIEGQVEVSPLRAQLLRDSGLSALARPVD